jgi:hypothetical protein
MDVWHVTYILLISPGLAHQAVTNLTTFFVRFTANFDFSTVTTQNGEHSSRKSSHQINVPLPTTG